MEVAENTLNMCWLMCHKKTGAKGMVSFKVMKKIQINKVQGNLDL
jgi:hypothetical protein